MRLDQYACLEDLKNKLSKLIRNTKSEFYKKSKVKSGTSSKICRKVRRFHLPYQ